MYFEPNEDQITFLTVLDQIVRSEHGEWKNAKNWARFDWSDKLDDMLEENGFFDCATEETLGSIAAAEMIFRLAKLPVLVESSASSLIRALYAPKMPRPMAIIDGRNGDPIRFLPVAKSVLLIEEDSIMVAIIDENTVTPVESQFAYPMGKLDFKAVDWKSIDVDVNAVQNSWRVAIAAELTGSLKGGLDSVLEHVRDRQQFGQPLGSFQAVQHRLATSATKIEAAYWLTLKAAQNIDPMDAVIALGYVQNISKNIVYDLHQFMGAMGLTLEHPLHRWTYRARLLRSSFGGASGNLRKITEKRRVSA